VLDVSTAASWTSSGSTGRGRRITEGADNPTQQFLKELMLIGKMVRGSSFLLRDASLTASGGELVGQFRTFA